MFQSGKDGRWERRGFFHRLNGERHFRQLQRVNDANAATRRNAGNGLRVWQARVHAGLGIEKKNAQQFDSFRHITIVAGDPVSCAEGRHGVAQLHDAAPVRDKILRVGQSVAPKVRQAVGFCRIGPPVIAVRIKIVRPASAQRRAEFCDGHRCQFERHRRRFQNTVVVNGGNINRGRRQRRAGGKKIQADQQSKTIPTIYEITHSQRPLQNSFERII